MFIYLSKKIAIPNNTKLNTIAWNKDNGYIAVGGEGGLLKVLKLDGGNNQETGSKSRGLAATSNLSMNQALEGHTDNIKVITWNETHKKLTTSDEAGVIIVWMLYKGAWYEEMINNRKKSTVVGMAWSTDGMKICIIYEDGAVIVGSVDGNRIWGKELKNIQLSGVQWSPDGKLLIFALRNGQVHVYDNLGNFAMRLDIQCLDPMCITETTIVGLDWYNGRYGYEHVSLPALAICYEDGRMQLMCNENDISPVIIDAGMLTTSCSWNHNGSLIAISGRHTDQDRQCNVVQFYNPFGDHLRTLKVPGLSMSCCVWEGGSLRVALAVDSFVYFANIRPDYKWCYFKKTVVFTSCRPQKEGICVSFWDTSNNQCHTKYVSVLTAIAGHGDHCVLVTASNEDDRNGKYGLLLCNTLGTPVDGIHVDIELQWVTMNSTHVIAASKSNFIVWQYKTPKYSMLVGGSRNRSRMYHIDDTPSGAVEVIQDLDQNIEVSVNTFPTNDAICCLASSNKILLVARESGLIQYYALPHTALYNRYKMSTRPHKMSINCNSTRLSVIDVSGVLTVVDMSEGICRSNGSPTTAAAAAAAATPPDNEREKLERKDVWAMCWASDNPQLLAIMEKTRMYIFKGNNPEEPISTSGYLCSFQDLEVQALLLDEVMATPDKPSKDKLTRLEVKSLRDTRQLLEKVGIKEAAQFIEDNPHPRLWRLLAEAALKEMDLSVAEAAFIRSNNYAGVAFVKKLRNISSEAVKKAQIATYFKQFDEAEKLYFEADRRDLALAMRQTLGDWFRVIQIMKNGVSAPDLVLEAAYNSAADYFAQFNNWSAAVEYYELARNRTQLVECYYHLEDYEGIAKVIEESPEGDDLLKQIGDMFSADGICNLAVEAYTKYGHYKSAIDLCVEHNKWDYAKELSKKYNIPEVFRLFSTHTVDLLDQKMLASAIEINVQTKNYYEAAQITFKLADEETKKTMKDARDMKQMYIYGAKLYQEFLKSKGNRVLSDAENVWAGAEAFHLYLLAHEHLYSGKIHYAMQTAFQLLDYMDYIKAKDVYTLLALTAYLDGSYGICSKAFSQFQSIPEMSSSELKQYEQLSLQIFEKYKAVDRRSITVACSSCQEVIPDWSTTCPNCYVRFHICMISGQSIIDDALPVLICSDCRHYVLKSETTYHKICPLCHISASNFYDD